MKKIITIQHTQSVHHTNGMVGSWTDWPLTALGTHQAHLIGKKLSKEIKDHVVMYTSDLLRAKQTAMIVAGYLEVDPIINPVLRERNLGIAVGKSVEWLNQHKQKDEVTVDDRLFEDAESKRNVYDKLKPFYEMLIKSQHDTIIVVSHGDTLSIFNALWLNMPIEMYDHCGLFGLAGGVSYLQKAHDGKHLIRKLSDMSYVMEE